MYILFIYDNLHVITRGKIVLSKGMNILKGFTHIAKLFSRIDMLVYIAITGE